jgi:histidinol phosphatase-like enzyme (inositol monophosphatase family)
MSEAALLLAAVADLAREGGRCALEQFHKTLAVEWKSDGSPVTQADRATETLMRDWIAARFPADGILGEEFPEHNPGAPRRWIVDPIDGTASFTRGIPLWGTLVGVARGERVIAGAICCPAVDELVCAANGEGCWHNGARCRVSEVAQLSAATVLTTDVRFLSSPEKLVKWNALAAAAGAARAGSDCHGYLLVATGRAEVMVDPVMSVWDAAALVPVIEEAGGEFTDWSNRMTAFGGSTIATNAALASEARRILGVEVRAVGAAR